MMKNFVGSVALLFAILASGQSVHGQAGAAGVGSAIDVTQSKQEKVRLIGLAKTYIGSALSSVTFSDRQKVKENLLTAKEYLERISPDSRERLIIDINSEIDAILQNLDNPSISNAELIQPIGLVSGKLQTLLTLLTLF